MTRTRSSGTPNAVAAICAMTASAPCPCSVTPVWQMIAPCASSLTVTPSWAEIFAPPVLQRIHADLLGSELDQAFGDGCRDRMPDRAILAHDILVLEYDARAGAVIRAGVRPAGQIDDLVRLDAGSARINRIRPNAG